MKNVRLDRRRMLMGTAGLAVSALAGGPGPEARGSEKEQKPHDGFLLGACDWTLGQGGQPESFAVAEKIGLDGVQVSAGTVEKGVKLRDPAVRKKLLEAAKKHGQQVSSLALGMLNQVPLKGDDPRPEQWIRDAVKACRPMGTGVILLAFFGNGDILDDEPGRKVVAEKLKRLAPVAEEAGVVLGVESWMNADQHLELLDRVDSPAVQVYYDVGNMQRKGYDICAEIRRLGDRICEFHAKDYEDLYGKGAVDFEAVREAMDHVGYRGWLVLEGVKTPLGLVESLRYDAEYLRKIFPRKA